MGISGGKWQGIRAKVLARDRGVCYLCDGFISDGEAEVEVDHLVELAEGGSHDLTNLASACASCPPDATVTRSGPRSA
jgi:5-methylcytosine-specific restriction protein A